MLIPVEYFCKYLPIFQNNAFYGRFKEAVSQDKPIWQSDVDVDKFTNFVKWLHPDRNLPDEFLASIIPTNIGILM